MTDPFITNTLSLYHENGAIIAQGLLCQLDNVNLPWNMEVSAMVPTDWFDLYSIGWTAPIPIRSDYFEDESDGTRYQMFSTIFIGPDTLQLRVSRYSGTTP